MVQPGGRTAAIRSGRARVLYCRLDGAPHSAALACVLRGAVRRSLRGRTGPAPADPDPRPASVRTGRGPPARRVLVIFPFEEALYREAGIPVSFVGHPLVDLVQPAGDRAAVLREAGLDPARPLIALLPGSRPGEAAHNLPPMAGAVALLHR